MTTCFLGPDPLQSTFFIPGSNTPGNGVQLFTYAAGSSTKVTCYKDPNGSTAHTNPIVLNSGGGLPSGSELWIPTGVTIKAVYAPANDTDPPASPYLTLDNLSGINDVSAQVGTEWISGPTPTYVGATQFTLVGDQTATFTKGRRLKSTNTSGTIYSTIVNSAFGVLTTVNVVSDVGTLDSGLSAVFYGILDPANPSVSPAEINRKGANIASSGTGTTDIWGIVGNYAHITGTNTINFFSTAPYPGAERDIVFDGALTLGFANPAMLINGGASLTTAANDRVKVRADTVSTFTIEFLRQNGQPNNYGLAASTGLSLSGTTTFSINVSTLSAFSTGTAISGGGTASTIVAQISQGTTGVWFAGATGIFKAPAGASSCVFTRLTDGTSNPAVSAQQLDESVVGIVSTLPFSLTGIFTNPTGNIRVTMTDTLSVAGVALSCNIWGMRIG